MSDVVVVESPAKAKTINRYLGAATPSLATSATSATCRPKDGSSSR